MELSFLLPEPVVCYGTILGNDQVVAEEGWVVQFGHEGPGEFFKGIRKNDYLGH